MAAINIQDVPDTGLAGVTFGAANGGGDTVAYGSKQLGGYDLYTVLLLVRNGDASSKTVTVSGTPVVVAAGATAAIPVPNEGLNDASVAVTYSAVTSVTVAAIRIGA